MPLNTPMLPSAVKAEDSRRVQTSTLGLSGSRVVSQQESEAGIPENVVIDRLDLVRQRVYLRHGYLVRGLQSRNSLVHGIPKEVQRERTVGCWRFRR